MTAVWTAMSLQRRDVASNSLSRSLGSLMMPPADDSVDDEEEDEEAEKEQQRGATVILHTNMATTDPSSSIQDPQSRWSVDSETQSSAPFVRQVSAPTPQFQKLVTNSASSITFLGKRITREYQSHFVLPDKQLVAVVRKETFLPEEAQSEVTLSLSVAAPPEISDTTRIGDTCRMKKRICDYLDPDDWASAILASSESRDAELLGRLGSKYSSSVTRRSRLERSTSRKSRKEIVLARELYSDDDDEEEAADVHMSSDDEDARSKLRSPAPAQPDRAYPSPNYPISRPSERVGTVKKTPPPTPPSSKFTPRSASPKSALTTPPIAAAYAETPGTRVKPLSDVRSRLNFEELRRKWDERVAREQMHLDEQVEQSRGSEQPPTVGYHPDGHRGSAVTSILPIHRKSKSRDQHELAGDANEGMAEHGRSSTQRYLANRTNTLSDPAYKPGSPRPGPITDYGAELYPQSPLSAQSEPVIDREEKDAKFSYNHENLRIGQENIDRTNPIVQGPRTSTVEGKRRESYSEQEQFDRYSPELPAVPPRFRDSATTDPTGKPGSTATRPMLPPKPSPGDYRSARKAAEALWERRQKSKSMAFEQEGSGGGVRASKSRPHSIANILTVDPWEESGKERRRGRVWDESGVKPVQDKPGRSANRVPPLHDDGTKNRRDSSGQGIAYRKDPHAKTVERNESDRKTDRARSRSMEVTADPCLGYDTNEDFVKSPEPRDPLPPAELQPMHTEAQPTPMGRFRKVGHKVQEWREKSEKFIRQTGPEPSEPAAATVRKRPSQAEEKTQGSEVRLSHTHTPGHIKSSAGDKDLISGGTGVIGTGKVITDPMEEDEGDRLGVLAPQPFRSRREVPVPASHLAGDQGQLNEMQKPRQSGTATVKTRKPRPVSMSSVPTMFEGSKSLVRRKSDLDRRLDEQIDQAYSEELTRRESMHTERGRSVDRESSSGLSALATYEEQQQRAKQIEELLKLKHPGGKPGRPKSQSTTITTTAASASAAALIKTSTPNRLREWANLDKSKKPQVSKKDSLRTMSTDDSSRRNSRAQSTHEKRTSSPDEDRNKDTDSSYPLEFMWERMAKGLSAHDYEEEQQLLSNSPTILVRDDAKRRPLVRSTSVKQTDYGKPVAPVDHKEKDDAVTSPKSRKLRPDRKEPPQKLLDPLRPRSDSFSHAPGKPKSKPEEVPESSGKRHRSATVPGTPNKTDRETDISRKPDKLPSQSDPTRKRGTHGKEPIVQMDENSDTEETDTTIKEKLSLIKAPKDVIKHKSDQTGRLRRSDKDLRISSGETHDADQIAAPTRRDQLPKDRKSEKGKSIQRSGEFGVREPGSRRRPASTAEKAANDVKETENRSESRPKQATWPRHPSQPDRRSHHSGNQDAVGEPLAKTGTLKRSQEPTSPQAGTLGSISRSTNDNHTEDNRSKRGSDLKQHGSKPWSSATGKPEAVGKGESGQTESGQMHRASLLDPLRDSATRVKPGQEHGRSSGRLSRRMERDETAPHTRPERLADQYNRQDLNVRPTPPPASPRLDADHQRLPESRPAQRPRESRDLEDDRAGANARTKYGEADAGRVQSNGQYGRKRHPPPPTSPPIRHGGRQIATGADSVGASETHSSQRRPPPVADPERAGPSVGRPGSRTPSYHEVSGGGGASGGGGGGRHHSHRSKPVDGSHTRNGHRPGPDNLVPWHPDEYNLQDEAHRAKHTTKGAREPDVYGATIPGELRKRPTSHTHDHKRTDRSSRHSTSIADKETKPSGHKPRHPSPPKPPAQRPEPKTNDRVHRSKRGHPESQSINQDMDSPYMNLPGSIPYGAKPLAEDVMKKSPPEYSDRSNEHSSYDPRVGDLADLSGHSRRPAQPAPPQPTPSGLTSIGREKHAPKASPRTQTLESDHQRGKSASRGQPGVVAQATHPRRAAQDDLFDSEDDDDDLDDSDGDEELKPPPLRISQTKQSSESLARSKKHSGGTPSGQPRTSTRISHHKPRSSPRGSLLSPGAMSAPSTQGYFAPGSLDKSHRSGHYRPEQFHSHQYEQISQDRASRPRSRRTTATSQEVVDPRAVSGSKHSLIISTKRRTLSGVTGTNPVKQRSSSMNALWFGDHPVPSSGALSPNAPFRLSAIQLQAQAELERRYRSSSRAHSLDRRSGLSHYGFGTESHLSRAPTEIEGYDGVGYGYDTRGRLIHGGAPLQERAISRKRRLQDGHESLSRVWIPQSEGTQRTLRSGDPSPSAATRLTERKANLDESAVAFALRDFTAPGSVRLWESGVDTDLSSASEHIYARPSSLLHSSELGTRLGSKARSKQLRDYSQGAVGAALNRDSRFYSTRSLYQNDAFPLVRLRRPRLVPNRWGSVPLPDSKQYDSLIRLSTHSITSRPSSTDPTKYMLESNV